MANLKRLNESSPCKDCFSFDKRRRKATKIGKIFPRKRAILFKIERTGAQVWRERL